MSSSLGGDDRNGMRPLPQVSSDRARAKRGRPAPLRAPPRYRLPERNGSGRTTSRLTRFSETPDFTVGVEEELQLVDPDDGHLVDRPEEIAAATAQSGGELQAEIFRSTVETATPVCEGPRELAGQMRRLRAWAVEAAEDEGLAISAAGTHPFATWESQATTDTPRYRQLVSELQLPMKRDLVFGQHVHVAVGSPEEALCVTNDLRSFLPLVLALSSNSPYWRGIDSGLQSARTNVSESMPRSGLPPSFENWAQLQRHLGTLRKAGSIEDMTKIWWDVRPRPDLGTVEIRIADQPTELETSVALASFTQALVVHLTQAYRREERGGLHARAEVVQENRWRALRDGLDAEFIELTSIGEAHLRSVQRMMESTVRMLEPTIQRMGIENEVAHLRERVDRHHSGADRQRAVYETETDLSAVVRDIAERTRP